MILQAMTSATVVSHLPSSSAHTHQSGHSEREVRVEALDIVTLMNRCATESDRFYKGKSHDTRYSYELFRRALVERNEQAWELLYMHYSPLVESWVRRSSAFASSGESSEFFVSGAFMKFWRAVTPERFETFPTLASLLQYLQLCTSSVVIDSVRAHSWSEMLPEEAAVGERIPHTSPDEEALQHVSSEEFWRIINELLNDECERTLVYASFVLGMAPRAITAQYSHLFSSVTEIYNIKRNILNRLGRNTTLSQLWNE